MKKILLSLMALFGVLAVNAEEVTFVVNDPSLWGLVSPKSGMGSYITSADKPNVSVTNGSVTLTTMKETASTNSVVWNTNDNFTFRSYKYSKLAISSTNNITEIKINGVSGKLAFTANSGSLNIDGALATWTGKENEVVLSFSGNSQLLSIVVTTDDGAGSDPVAVESVSLTDAAGNALGMYTALTVTDKMQVKAVVTPSNATNKKVTWEVMQNSEVISFDEATGTVTALAEGQAALVANTEDGGFQAAITFYVSPIADGTIADFIAAEGKTCYLTGVVSNIKNTTYGNFDLTDESGTIYVYGCLNAAGESKKFAEFGVSEGDKIKVLASKYQLYGETQEAVNVVFVENFGPAAPATEVTFTIEEDGTQFTITPSDNEVKYYVELLPSGFDAETIAAYFDSNFEEMGSGLEYFTGVSTQSYEDDWYLDPGDEGTIWVCAVSADYKRISELASKDFTVSEGPADNTIAAGKYTLTADVALAKGVTEAMVPADFKKYVGTYKSNATLVGDEKSLTIDENDENGLFTGFEIKGDAVALAADKTITLNGKVFNVRTAADEENGSLAITADGDNYKMDAANVWYNGMKVATITNIVIAKASSTGIKAVSVKALNGKFIENGKFVIISNGKKFNVAGVEMK